MEAMLKKEEVIEEERVKKIWRKKGSSVWRPTGPRGLTGAQEQRHATHWRPGAPMGATWAPFCRKKSTHEFRVSTPYISFLTPPSLPPSSPRSKIPSSLKVFIISLNPHSNPPHSTPNLLSFLSSTTISTPFLPPTFSNLHLHPWQHPWMSLGFHLLWVAKHSWVFGDEKMVQSFMGFIGEFLLFHALSLYIWDMWLLFLMYFG